MIIKNIKRNQRNSIYPDGNKSVTISSNKLDIINSNIGEESKKWTLSTLSLISKNEINMTNSNIATNKIICRANKIKLYRRSSLKAQKQIDTKVTNYNFLTLTAPTILVNGHKCSSKGTPIIVKKIDSIKLKRIQLIQNSQRNKKELRKYKQSLKNKSINKVQKNKLEN